MTTQKMFNTTSFIVTTIRSSLKWCSVFAVLSSIYYKKPIYKNTTSFAIINIYIYLIVITYIY